MEQHHINDMTNGWFVGNFDPTIQKTDQFEVALKTYRAGDTEERHYHKVAREITLVVSGTVEMCGRTFNAGDIIVLEPGEATAFKAVTDVTNVVVKTPSVAGDKYIENNPD